MCPSLPSKLDIGRIQHIIFYYEYLFSASKQEEMLTDIKENVDKLLNSTGKICVSVPPILANVNMSDLAFACVCTFIWQRASTSMSYISVGLCVFLSMCPSKNLILSC